MDAHGPLTGQPASHDSNTFNIPPVFRGSPYLPPTLLPLHLVASLPSHIRIGFIIVVVVVYIPIS